MFTSHMHFVGFNSFYFKKEMFDVCTTGGTSNISSRKKNFFCFPVAVNNSLKVGPGLSGYKYL
jgi:hypothetical protein